MNVQRFKNNEVRKILCGLLGKKADEYICVEELEKIDRLNINPRIFDKVTLRVELDDLSLLKNLKELYIRDIYISDYEIHCINQAISLKYLQINKCKFEDMNVELNLEHLDGLSIVASHNLDIEKFKNLQNLKILKIIGGSVKNYRGFELLPNLEEIYLQSLDYVDLKRMLKIYNLKLLNLDGSTVKNLKYEAILKDRIQVQHAEKFMVI